MKEKQIKSKLKKNMTNFNGRSVSLSDPENLVEGLEVV